MAGNHSFQGHTGLKNLGASKEVERLLPHNACLAHRPLPHHVVDKARHCFCVGSTLLAKFIWWRSAGNFPLFSSW